MVRSRGESKAPDLIELIVGPVHQIADRRPSLVSGGPLSRMPGVRVARHDAQHIAARNGTGGDAPVRLAVQETERLEIDAALGVGLLCDVKELNVVSPRRNMADCWR